MAELIEIIIGILPFIFGLIAISIIPGKEKILKKQVTSFRVEVLVVVYLIALFILALGFYFFVPLFGENSDFTLINIFNGGLLTLIGLGVMGLNYRNYSLFSKPVAGAEGRIEVDEVQAIEISDTYKYEPEPISQPEADIQTVGCPNCGEAIKVDASHKPFKISCPNCGIEGMVQ